jgi:hypothetical protein
MNRALRWTALFVGLGAPGCDRDDIYGESTFSQNVAQAYAECDAGEIKFLTGKHAINLGFKPCGSNKFAAASWSPDGTLLYFQLTHGGHILVGETGDVETIPTETPVGPATWIRDNYLVLPLAPSGSVEFGASEEQAHERAADAKGPWRLAMYDRGSSALELIDLPVTSPRDLQHTGIGTQIAMTAVGDDGVRRAWLFDPLTAETSRLLPWWEGALKSLHVAGDLVAFKDGEDVTIRRRDDGSEVALVKGANRVVLHPEGRYAMAEMDGKPISLFAQEGWRELDPEREAREKARQAQWVENLPEWAPTEAVPPELHVLDLEKKQRTRITAYYGKQFEWLPREDYWCSMLLWGVEGKQLHANVGYLNIRERLRMLDGEETPYGMERLDWATGEPVSKLTGSPSGVSPENGETAEVAPKTPDPGPK